jgi:hypothetical protein
MAPTSAPLVVDLEDIILTWARQHDLPKDLQHKVDMSKLCAADINLQRLRIINTPPEHELNRDPRAMHKAEKTYVLFSSTFSNNTDHTQSHNLRTERRTTSSCRISVSRALTIGTELRLGLTPPNPILSANAGFKSDFTLEKTNEMNFEEELVWSLDSQIEVQPRSKTRAELVIKEDEYDGNFKVETILEGIINVKLRSKVNGDLITIITCNDISQIFTPEKGFTKIEAGKVKFVNVGRCFCRYGVEQKVDVTQLPLD